MRFLLLMLLLAAIINAFKLPMQFRGLRSNRPSTVVLFESNEEGSQVDNTKPTAPARSNIDLFAANTRKMPTSIPSQISASASSQSAYSGTASGGLVGQQSKNALQAEILRLEAEIEQLSIDETSIETRKKKLIEIDRLLIQVIVYKSISLTEVVTSHKSLVGKEMYFRIAELANNAHVTEEKQMLVQMCADLLEAAKNIDPSLHADLTATIERELTGIQPTAIAGQGVGRDADNAKAYDQVLQQWIRQTERGPTGAFNFTLSTNSTMDLLPSALQGGKAMVRFPSAIPFNMLPLMLRSPELSDQDVAVLRQAVFSKDILDKCISDHSVFLATFRGNPTVSALDTFQNAQSRIDLIPGMAERVRLFVLPEYTLSATANANNTMTEKYTGTKFEPVFVVLSRQAEPKLAGIEYPAVLLALLGSLATSFIYATDVNSLNAGFVEKALAGDETVVGRVFSIIVGLFTLQIAHEAGHFAAATVHKVKLGAPFILPSLQIGIFGAVTRFLSFPKTRKAMFDVAIAGPLTGLIYSLGTLIFGLDLTATATPEVLAQLPALPTGFFSTSFLLYELTDKYLHIEQAAKTANSLTPVHPFVVIGMTGVLINSFNLLPIGRLDGGRIATSILGRRSASSVSFAALVSQAFSLLSNASPVAFFWLLVVVFLQRGQDLPPENDITAIGSSEEAEGGAVWIARLAALVFCSLVAGATLLPVPVDPSVVTNQVNIFGGQGPFI